MALLRTLIAGPPPLNRYALCREYCRRIGWFKPDGGLKDMMAKVTMLAMHKDGLIALPPPKWPRPPAQPIVFGPDTEPPPHPAPTTLDEIRPLSLRTLVRYTSEGKRWNEFIARYHYVGYKTLVGAQMRYAVHDRQGRPLAMLGFSTAARKLAPPWITIPNLGSHILAIVRRRLPQDAANSQPMTSCFPITSRPNGFF